MQSTGESFKGVLQIRKDSKEKLLFHAQPEDMYKKTIKIYMEIYVACV